ncbi:MAG: hypothetical protein QOI80_580, partial [Solirubrobacteraceae bacterium]|nr:hypothetical protein [Solirubrobacteraceae bacterium]
SGARTRRRQLPVPPVLTSALVLTPEPTLAPAIHELLLEHTLAWAREVADAVLRIERDELRTAVEVAAPPVLIAAANTPRLRSQHAAWALDDLAHGAEVSFGPGFDGGWYLVALPRPTPAVLDLLEGRGSPFELGLEIGLLRAERLLSGRGDAAALAKDPLVASGVRELLR